MTLHRQDAAHPAVELGVASEETCRGFEFGDPRWTQRARHACLEMARDNGAGFLHAVIANMPKAMFVFLPLIAFLHMLMYWRPRYRYAEHLLFFLHLHAFFFSVMIVDVLLRLATERWSALEGTGSVASALLLCSLPVYALIAMRRVFQRRWTETLLKLCALSIAYVIALALTITAVFVYTAVRL
jgi:hypothetical protein